MCLAALALCAVVAWARGAVGSAADDGGLPDRDTFLREVRPRLHADATLLQPYVYRRSISERDHDDRGRVTAVHTRVYEVHPLPDDSDGFRILLSRDGNPEPPDAIRRALDDYRRRLDRFARADSPSERQRRRARQAAQAREDQASVDDVVRLFEVTLVRRETMNGIPSVLVAFSPRPGVEPRTRAGRIVRNVSGRAWFSEREYELVRVQARVDEPITYGWGIIARINEGATATIDRQRFPDGRWLPARYHFVGEGRVMLFKSIERDATVEFSDYRRAPSAAAGTP